MLLPITIKLAQPRTNSSISDLVKSYPNLKASGMELDSLHPREEEAHSLEEDPSQIGYELLSVPKNRESRPEYAFIREFVSLYLKMGE